MITPVQRGDDSRRNWRTINDCVQVINDSVLPASSQAGAVARLRTAPRDPEHRLRPYQSSTWLKWAVSTGYVVTTGAPVIPTGVDTEFTLTSGVARWWFYVDFSSTPEILTSSSDLDWSAELVPLGWVDTQTYAATNRAIFHPVALFNPCI